MKKIVLILIALFLLSSSAFAYVKTSQIDVLFTLGISRSDVEIRNCGEGSFEVIRIPDHMELVGDNFKKINCYSTNVYSPVDLNLEGEGDSGMFLFKGKDGVRAFYILGAATENGSFWWSSITIPIYLILVLGFVVGFIYFFGKGIQKAFGIKFK